MSDQNQLKLLKISLVFVGILMTFGLSLFMMLWSSAWTWEPRQPEYEQMMMGVYATLGIFLLIAARNPLEHRSLIWFTVWSSIVHGAIMLAQALMDPTETANLYGDVPALFLIAIVLGLLMLKAQKNPES